MADNQQRQHSQVWPLKKTTSNRTEVAVFSGKCFMLGGILDSDDFSEDMKETVVDSMFEQSFRIIGIN